jgi:hypothetical protein
MERGPFLSRPVQEAFADLVEVVLYTDGPEANRKNRDFQKDRFGTVALPYYVLLDPTGEKVLWQGGGKHDAKPFAAALRTPDEP